MRHIFWHLWGSRVSRPWAWAARSGRERRTGAIDAGPVEVRVENRSWSDAAIYLVSNGLVQRIGLATAAGTTTLWVPARLLGQSSDVRIVSAPIGSNRSHATDPLLVRPGSWFSSRWTTTSGSVVGESGRGRWAVGR